MQITLNYGEWFDEVLIDEVSLDPARSQAVWNHSPDGFSWGYSGSGPAQLALALLLAAGLDDKTAVDLHQEFKREFVAKWPQHPPRGFTVDIDVDAWVATRVAARETS